MTMAHMHPTYEMLLVLDPLPYSTVVNGEIFRGKGPIVMITAPYCMHFTYYTDYTITNKKYVAFYIGEDFIKNFGEDLVPIKTLLGDTKARILNVEGHEEALRRVLDQVVALMDKKRRLKDRRHQTTVVNQKLFFCILVNMINDLTKNGNSQTVNKSQNYISDVITYIVHNLDKNLRTPNIAEQFFVSRDKLNRDFKKYTQMSIRDFITESRMNLAKSQLIERKKSIREISAMCGFENEVYFYSFLNKIRVLHRENFPKERNNSKLHKNECPYLSKMLVFGR